LSELRFSPDDMEKWRTRKAELLAYVARGHLSHEEAAAQLKAYASILLADQSKPSHLRVIK
jgi:hypothetical protein